MYFRDLELCRYAHGHLTAENWAVPLRAIGWIAYPHPFERGSAPLAFILRLGQLVDESCIAFALYHFLGTMKCSVCVAEGTPSPGPVWSQDTILVPGDGEVFVAPAGIVHYVEAHSYLPPDSFIEATRKCPAVGSPNYMTALRAANLGRPIPFADLSTIESGTGDRLTTGWSDRER